MATTMMGPLGEVAGKLKSFVTKTDKVTIDNILFRVHHQVNFAVISLGLVFIFAENYIIGGVIECTGSATDYDKKFCFIHGTSYIAPSIAQQLSGKDCIMTDGKDSKTNTVVTAYYMWLPFVLVLCMVINKIPRSVWKTGEGGFMHSLVGDQQDPEKIAETFRCIKKRNKFFTYNVSFAICEILNIISIFVNIQILHSLLNSKFWSYGMDVKDYYSQNSEVQQASPNPMCNVFPTEVGCHVSTGGVAGGEDTGNHLCILSNNVFNQYFFLLLWWWWVVLLTGSFLGVVYRLVQLALPQVSRGMLKHRLDQSALSEIDPTAWKLSDLSSADFFILARMALNLEGQVMARVLSEIKKRNVSSKKSRSGEEGLELPSDKDLVKVSFQSEEERVAFSNKGMLD